MVSLSTPSHAQPERDDSVGVLRIRLRDSPLLDELSPAQLDTLIAVARIERYPGDGEAIVVEGDPADGFYLVLDGAVEIYKRSPSSAEDVHLGTLGPGSHFGEASLMRVGRRTATVRAEQAVELLVIDAEALRDRQDAQTWLLPVLLQLVAQSSARLDLRSQRLVESLEAELGSTKLRLETNRLLVYVVVLMSVYALGLAFSAALRSDPFVAKLTNTGLFLIFGVVLFALVKGSARPLSFFGVRRPERWRAEIGEALVATGLFLAAVTLAKLALISLVPTLAHVRLIELSTFDTQKLVLMSAYLLLVPIQEMCIRGVLQGSFAEFLREDPGVRWKAILLSNAIFAAVHAHMSPYFALGVFLPGLFWGWLYARQTSLVGVVVSHALVGIFTLDVLGLKSLLT